MVTFVDIFWVDPGGSIQESSGTIFKICKTFRETRDDMRAGEGGRMSNDMRIHSDREGEEAGWLIG